MLAYCFNNGLDGLGLTGTRLAALGVSTYALTVLWRLCRAQPREKAYRQVSRLAVVFTLIPLTVVAVTSFFLLVQPCAGTPLSAPVRTLYGQGFAWSIGGLAIIVSLGIQHSIKMRATVKKIPADVLTDAVQRIIDEHPDLIESPKGNKK